MLFIFHKSDIHWCVGSEVIMRYEGGKVVELVLTAWLLENFFTKCSSELFPFLHVGSLVIVLCLLVCSTRWSQTEKTKRRYSALRLSLRSAPTMTVPSTECTDWSRRHDEAVLPKAGHMHCAFFSRCCAQTRNRIIITRLCLFSTFIFCIFCWTLSFWESFIYSFVFPSY